MRDDTQMREIEIEMLPELETEIGMIGTLRQTEVGGMVCMQSGVAIITGPHG